ncbi:MAG: hypothetical protein ACRD3G_01410 [Vicinamibacterales bacterium]
MPLPAPPAGKYGCQPGDKTGHVFTLSPPSFTATFTTATHDVEPVYRALSAADLLVRREGLIVWEELVSVAPTVTNDGILLTVAETQEFLCSDRMNYPRYALSVRSGGIWLRLWPTLRLDLEPGDYEKRLAPARTLIERMIDRK